MMHIHDNSYNRLNERLLLSAVLFPLLVMDWNYARPSFTLPLIISYPGWVVTICLTLFYIIRKRHFISIQASAIFKIFSFLGIVILTVFFLQRFFYPETSATYNKFNYIEFISLSCCALTGYFYACRLTDAQRLFKKFAQFAAWASLFSFFLRIIGIPLTIPFGIAGWPTRLFLMFGFCWYLALFLSGEKTNRRKTVFGLVSCSLEVIMTLHKPIIFSTIISIVILLLLFRINLSKKLFNKTIIRWIRIIAISAILLFAVNKIFKGIVVNQIQQFIIVRVLHLHENDKKITLERSDGGRIGMWEYAFKNFGKSPWLGFGISSINDGTRSLSFHNGYLDLLFMLGICGFVPAFIALLIWLFVVWKSLACTPLLLVQASCFAYMAGIMGFNLGSTSRLFAGSSYFIAMICGLSLRLAADTRRYMPAEPKNHTTIYNTAAERLLS